MTYSIQLAGRTCRAENEEKPVHFNKNINYIFIDMVFFIKIYQKRKSYYTC